MASATDYLVENSWGGTTGHYGGLWVLGVRGEQLPVAFDLTSDDGGKTLTGTMTYEGEGPIGFNGKYIGSNNYKVEVQWGGSDAPWQDSGVMVIGYRGNEQMTQELKITSPDGGKSFEGNMVYAGEGPIGLNAKLQDF